MSHGAPAWGLVPVADARFESRVLEFLSSLG